MRAPKPVRRGAGAGVRVDQVVDVDGDHHVRLDACAGSAGSRRPARCRPTARTRRPSCWLRLRRSPGRPVGLHHRLQHGLATFSPPTASSSKRPGPAAVGVLGHREPPALGGVGLGAVGVQPLQVVVHHLRQLARAAGWRRRRPAPRRPRRGRPRPRRPRPGAPPGDRGDHRHRLGGHPPGGERRRPPPAGAPAPGRCATSRCAAAPRQPAVPAQPRLHRLRPVVLGRLGQLALPHGAGHLRRPGGSSAVSSRRDRVEHLRAEHARQILGRQAGRGRARDRRAGHPNHPNTCTNNTGDDPRPHPESPGQKPVHRVRQAVASRSGGATDSSSAWAGSVAWQA